MSCGLGREVCGGRGERWVLGGFVLPQALPLDNCVPLVPHLLPKGVNCPVAQLRLLSMGVQTRGGQWI